MTRPIDQTMLEAPMKAAVVLAALNERPGFRKRIMEVAGFPRGTTPSIADVAEIWHLIARQADHYGRRVGASDFEASVRIFLDDYETESSAAVSMLEKAARREAISRHSTPFPIPQQAPESLRAKRKDRP